jgi:uncharacterized protein YbjT (DUF2867 family)
MIVITTPTGQIGRQVFDKILEEIPSGGEPIRVIARDPSRLDAHTRERVEVVAGSHDDIGVVTEAFTGADTVFWLVPPNFHAESVEAHYLSFTRPACEAIESQGVKRLVGVTSLGRGYEKDAGLLSAAFTMDELIERTGVSHRELGMPFFMENLLNQIEALKSQGMFFMANSSDRPLSTVATRDIATVASGLLLDDSWSGQEGVPVIGPDDLSPNEMAQVISEVLERPIRFQQVGVEDYKATMVGYGASEAFAQGMANMTVAQNDGVYDAEARVSQRGATSFRRWCEEVLKPAFVA